MWKRNEIWRKAKIIINEKKKKKKIMKSNNEIMAEMVSK